MLMPERTKYRKKQKGKMRGKAHRGSSVAFGEYGMKALERGWINGNQIEAARVAVNRKLKGNGKIWIRIFPDKPITQKPAETRMGKGKGEPEYYVSVIKPGRILFEVKGVDKQTAKRAFELASYKLPMKTKFVERHKG